MTSKLASLDDYFASLEVQKASTLREVIDFILSEFPHLECKMAWNVPQIHLHGKYILGVSALKSHLALAPWSSRVIEDFRDRLETNGYVVRKNLFQIPIDWEIDTELLKDLVQARLIEVETLQA